MSGANGRFTEISASQALAALVERREIHERELHRPLKLVNVGAGKKYDGVRRIDAPDRLAQSVRLRIGEKPEHRLLRLVSSVGVERINRSRGQCECLISARFSRQLRRAGSPRNLGDERPICATAKAVAANPPPAMPLKWRGGAAEAGRPARANAPSGAWPSNGGSAARVPSMVIAQAHRRQAGQIAGGDEGRQRRRPQQTNQSPAVASNLRVKIADSGSRRPSRVG